MTDSEKIKLLHTICDRNPHMRLTNALWKVRKAELAQELRLRIERDRPHPRGIVTFIRKTIWGA